MGITVVAFRKLYFAMPCFCFGAFESIKTKNYVMVYQIDLPIFKHPLAVKLPCNNLCLGRLYHTGACVFNMKT